jgi:hypothetical protein
VQKRTPTTLLHTETNGCAAQQINFANQISSSKGACRSVDLEIHRTLWKPEIHYRVYISPLLGPSLHKFNPVHTTHYSGFLSHRLILLYLLGLRLRNGVLL